LNLYEYHTSGGKNVILEYIDNLPKSEKFVAYAIRQKLKIKGLNALDELNTRQLKGKLWEIKFSQNRLMYVVADKDNMYIVHACKKQKDKAEKFEMQTAISRAKQLGFNI